MVDHLSETGSGITRRRTKTRTLDSDDAISELKAGSAAMFDFETYTADLRANAEAVVKQIGAKHGIKPWRAHEDLEWYYCEMIRQHDSAREHIARGDASGAACAALRFQNVCTEMQFKFRYEDAVAFASVAGEIRESQREAGRKRRKRPDDVRVECWRQCYAQCGKKTEADRLAAERLGEGESTIRAARRKWEIAAGTTI